MAAKHWFHDKSPAAKKAYIAAHPTSMYAKGSKMSKHADTKESHSTYMAKNRELAKAFGAAEDAYFALEAKYDAAKKKDPAKAKAMMTKLKALGGKMDEAEKAWSSLKRGPVVKPKAAKVKVPGKRLKGSY